MLTQVEAFPSGEVSLKAPKPRWFHSYIILAKLVIFAHIEHVFHMSAMLCRLHVKLIACWMEVDQWISPPGEVFMEVVC